MKRLIALILAAALCLTGCALAAQDDDTVTFYYLRRELTYGAADSVLVPERRSVAGAGNDLSYLTHLYLSGALDDNLRLPLPAGTRLTGVELDGHTCRLFFSPEFATMEGMELTLACACISATFFSLTPAQTIVLEAPAPEGGNPVSLTLTRDSFLLYDDITTAADAS